MMHKDINHSQQIPSFVEDIKEDLKEVERVDDSLTIHQENSNVCEDIKKEKNNEENVEVSTFNKQEIGNVWLDHSKYRKYNRLVK